LQEKKEGVIRLEDDVNVIRCFVDFCYGGSYDEDERSEGVSKLLHHAMMYTVGEKYDNAALREVAKNNFTTVCDVIAPPWVMNQEVLDLIRYIFKNTLRRTDPLRRTLLTILSTCDLRVEDETALCDILKDVPDLGVALVSRFASQIAKHRQTIKYLRETPQRCSPCDRELSCPNCDYR